MIVFILWISTLWASSDELNGIEMQNSTALQEQLLPRNNYDHIPMFRSLNQYRTGERCLHGINLYVVLFWGFCIPSIPELHVGITLTVMVLIGLYEAPPPESQDQKVLHALVLPQYFMYMMFLVSGLCLQAQTPHNSQANGIDLIESIRFRSPWSDHVHPYSLEDLRHLRR